MTAAEAGGPGARARRAGLPAPLVVALWVFVLTSYGQAIYGWLTPDPLPPLRLLAPCYDIPLPAVHRGQLIGVEPDFDLVQDGRTVTVWRFIFDVSTPVVVWKQECLA